MPPRADWCISTDNAANSSRRSRACSRRRCRCLSYASGQIQHFAVPNGTPSRCATSLQVKPSAWSFRASTRNSTPYRFRRSLASASRWDGATSILEGCALGSVREASAAADSISSTANWARSPPAADRAPMPAAR